LKNTIKFLFLPAFIFLAFFAKAQAPEGINYQAVIRKTDGTLVTNSSVAIRVQIKQSSSIGTLVYSERQSVVTSQYGLVNFVIGSGTLLSGNFSAINWSTGNYWVCLAVDFANGTNYVDFGSQRLMSTPYALYAKTSGVQLNQWRYGAVAPAAALGNVGDYYLDTATGNVYYKSAGTIWNLTGNIKGPIGPVGLTGATGLTGPVGPQGLAGIAGPAGATGPIGLTGAQGATGPQGPVGATGPQGNPGTNGNTMLNGMTAPSAATGVNGDYYINSVTHELFGPKTNGVWPAGISLVGPVGPSGASGPTGATGPAGLAGTNGTNGTNGLNALVKTTVELAGANCVAGGTKVETGLDANNNGVLDLAEINAAQTTFVCNGANVSIGQQTVNNISGIINVPNDFFGADSTLVINQSGSAWWCCGPSFTVPNGKLWKIVRFTGATDNLIVDEDGLYWLNEGETLTWKGNGSNGSNQPFSFMAWQYSKSQLSFNVYRFNGTGYWNNNPPGNQVAWTVPTGKVWKIKYLTGACQTNFGIGERWLDEGQTISFTGNGSNGSTLPFSFLVFEYSKY
jgi:hypothetical protein